MWEVVQEDRARAGAGAGKGDEALREGVGVGDAIDVVGARCGGEVRGSGLHMRWAGLGAGVKRWEWMGASARADGAGGRG